MRTTTTAAVVLLPSAPPPRQLPLFGPALFGLRKVTAYDQAGNVRAVMTAVEFERTFERERPQPHPPDRRSRFLLPFRTGRKPSAAASGRKPGALGAANALDGRRGSEAASPDAARASACGKAALARTHASAATPPSPPASGGKEEEASAAKIQALARGRQARRVLPTVGDLLRRR